MIAGSADGLMICGPRCVCRNGRMRMRYWRLMRRTVILAGFVALAVCMSAAGTVCAAVPSSTLSVPLEDQDRTYFNARAQLLLEAPPSRLPPVIDLVPGRTDSPPFRLVRKRDETSTEHFSYELYRFGENRWQAVPDTRITVNDHETSVEVVMLYLSEQKVDMNIIEEGIGTSIMLFIARYAQVHEKDIELSTKNYGLLQLLYKKISGRVRYKEQANGKESYAPVATIDWPARIAHWKENGKGVTIAIQEPCLVTIPDVFVDWNAERRFSYKDQWFSVCRESTNRLAVSMADEEAGPYRQVKAIIEMPRMVDVLIKRRDIFVNTPGIPQAFVGPHEGVARELGDTIDFAGSRTHEPFSLVALGQVPYEAKAAAEGEKEARRVYKVRIGAQTFESTEIVVYDYAHQLVIDKWYLGYSFTPYRVTLSDIRRAVLRSLGAYAMREGKDIVLKDVNSYCLMQEIASCLGRQARYLVYTKEHDTRSFDRAGPFHLIQWSHKYAPITVNVTNDAGEDLYQEFVFDRGSGAFVSVNGNTDQLLLREKNGELQVAWADPARHDALYYQIYLGSASVDILVRSNEIVLPPAEERGADLMPARTALSAA